MTDAELLALLAEVLGAEVLDPADPHRCPGCLTATTPSPRGDRTYCLPCCMAELGFTFLDNAVRIEFGMTWGQYWARADKYGPAWINRHAWTTSAAKLRQLRKR